MADPSSLFDLPLDTDAADRADAEAYAEIESGRGVGHDRVRQWLKRLAQGENVPPPLD